MARLLEGRISRLIHRKAKRYLLKGTLRRSVPATGDRDEYNDPVDAEPETFKLVGFHDETTRIFEGEVLPITDLLVNILAESLKTEPTQDDVVSLTQRRVTRWYQLRSAKVDPAGAMWICRAFRTSPPE